MKRSSLALAALALLLGSLVAAATALPIAVQRVAIRVTSKGFEPASVNVRSGRPITLIVTRTTDRTCAKEFVILDRGIHRPLPLGKPVEIALAPEKPGAVSFACGMRMVRGTLMVR